MRLPNLSADVDLTGFDGELARAAYSLRSSYDDMDSVLAWPDASVVDRLQRKLVYEFAIPSRWKLDNLRDSGATIVSLVINRQCVSQAGSVKAEEHRTLLVDC